MLTTEAAAKTVCAMKNLPGSKLIFGVENESEVEIFEEEEGAQKATHEGPESADYEAEA